MKITGSIQVESVIDVQCDVCGVSTQTQAGGLQYGTLQAHWGFGAKHDGQRYEVHLCESCFFGSLAYIKQERRILNMFDKVEDAEDLGLVARDDFFRDLSA